jgi:hypothetical protein
VRTGEYETSDISGVYIAGDASRLVQLAIVAAASLVDAQQACFFSYPAVPCPGGGDWRVGLLTFAFFGVPLIWLVGVVVAVVGRAVARRRRERRPSSRRDSR